MRVHIVSTSQVGFEQSGDCLYHMAANPPFHANRNSDVNAAIRYLDRHNHWKSLIICPIYAKGGKNDLANYNPVCLTFVACQVIERIVTANIPF